MEFPVDLKVRALGLDPVSTKLTAFDRITDKLKDKDPFRGMDASAQKFNSAISGLNSSIKQQGSTNAQLATQLRKLRGDYDSLTQAAKASARAGGEGFNQETISRLRGLSTEIARTREEFRSGKAAAADYRAELDRVGAAAARSGKSRGLGRAAAAGAGAAGAFSGIPGLAEISAGVGAGSLAGGPAGAAVGAIAAGLTVAAVGAVRASKGIAEYSANVSRLRIALEGVSGSQAAYNLSLTELDRIATRLNIPTADATEQFTQLRASMAASGYTAQQSLSVYESLAAANTALGGNSEKLQGILLATSQIFSKGSVSAEELRGQIGERLPGAFSEFAKATGRSTQELDKALQRGEVSLNDFLLFAMAVGRKYGNTADAMAGSTQSAGARLTKAVEGWKLIIGPELERLGGMFQSFAADAINALTSVINQLAQVGGAIEAKLTGSTLNNAREGFARDAQTLKDLYRTPKDQRTPEQTQRIQTLERLQQGRMTTIRQANPKPAATAAVAPAPLPAALTPAGSAGGGGASALKGDQRIEAAVRKGVIGGMTGGGQADASRGRSTGPHLHAQLVSGGNLERLVDSALDFGGGRTASSFGLGRGAASHGYPGRDYYTPQGTPFTLKPGWTAKDMGIQGALGRGMRISGPGGSFELGHLAGVKTGDLTGAGASSDMLDAQQEMLNNYAESQQRGAELLRTFTDQLDVLVLQGTAGEEIGRIQRDFLGRQQQIAELADPLQRADAEGLSLRIKQVETTREEVRLLYEQLDASELLNKSYGQRAFSGRFDRSQAMDGFNPSMPNLNPGSGDGGYKLSGQFEKVQAELKGLTDPINQITAGAQAIGAAFGESFKGVASGAMTAQQALQNFFQRVADHFLGMASQMIAKWIEMKVLGLATSLLGGVATGGAASGGYTLPGGSGFAQGFSLPSFAGGGFTGDGGRSGGVDGQGGFPALLHPGETVVDHRQGNSGMSEALQRYRPGGGVREQMDESGAGGRGGAGGASPITLNVTATRFGDSEFVKVNDLQVALAETRAEAAKQGALMGERRALNRLQQSPGTRRRLGL